MKQIQPSCILGEVSQSSALVAAQRVRKPINIPAQVVLTIHFPVEIKHPLADPESTTLTKNLPAGAVEEDTGAVVVPVDDPEVFGSQTMPVEGQLEADKGELGMNDPSWTLPLVVYPQKTFEWLDDGGQRNSNWSKRDDLTWLSWFPPVHPQTAF